MRLSCPRHQRAGLNQHLTGRASFRYDYGIRRDDDTGGGGGKSPLRLTRDLVVNELRGVEL